MTAPTMDERRAVAARLRALIGGRIDWTGLQCAVFGGTALRSDTVARLAELIDPGEDVSVSVYDLMPEDDREALEWVREHGGLGQVKMDYTMGEGFTDLADRIAAKLGVDVEGLDAQDIEPVIMDAIDRRLMPEGMEWPRFEDGETVRFGDRFENADGGESVLHTLIAKDFRESLGDGVFWKLGKGAKAVWLKDGERVKRPAPKVLDADEVEIRVGDTVWTTRDLDKFTVTNPNNGKFLSVSCKGEDGEDYCCYPTDLTHRAPVLAADGKPLREGETVYKLDDGRPYTLKWFDGDHVYINAGGSSFDIWTFPDKLTHERPDSLERLAEDIGAMATAWRAKKDLFDAQEAAAGCVGKNTLGAALDSLVRRARALAECDV